MVGQIHLTVTIEPEPRRQDLSAIAGRWGSQIDVRITNPYRITQGPVEVSEVPSVVPELRPFPSPDDQD